MIRMEDASAIKRNLFTTLLGVRPCSGPELPEARP